MREVSEKSVPVGAMFRLASGGWVLLLALVIGILIVVLTLMPALERIADRPPGDGRTPESYGFVLEPTAIPDGQLIAAQLHRDMAAPMVDPEALSPAEVTEWAAENRGKYLVSSDPVVGVVVDGVARAYPLGWMHFHEVANDVLGGVPILVVTHPLSRTVAVYDRRIERRTVEFGTSGLMRDCTVLLYARERDASGELIVEGPGATLWDPRTGSAMTGPDLEAGARLERLPFVLTHYGDWLELHPETTVMSRDDLLLERYQKASFDRYWAEDEPLFPITEDPPTPPGRLEACIVIPGDAETPDLVIPSSWIDALARTPRRAVGERPASSEETVAGSTAPRTWWIDVDGRRIGLVHRDDPETITAIDADGGPITHVHSAWFSWWRTGRAIRVPTPPTGRTLGPGLEAVDVLRGGSDPDEG